jgi:hypothetical protein
MAPMTTRERRGAVRRNKAIRFRFEGDGQLRRAVTADASATGLLLKASWVPVLGARVVLHERQEEGAPLHVVGEVVRTHAEPTLASPETSFAIRLEEAWTREDSARLTGFVDGLALEVQPNISQVEREGAAAYLHCFGPVPPTSRLVADLDPQASPAPRPRKPAEKTSVPEPETVNVLWTGGKTVARVIEVSDTLVRLACDGGAPPFYAWVQISGHGTGRLLEGTVSRVGTDGPGGARTFAVRTRTAHALEEAGAGDVPGNRDD